MRFLHRNLGSCVIIAPILAAISSVLTPTTAGGGIEVEAQKYQEQQKEKVEDGGTEF